MLHIQLSFFDVVVHSPDLQGDFPPTEDPDLNSDRRKSLLMGLFSPNKKNDLPAWLTSAPGVIKRIDGGRRVRLNVSL